ncbi:hypothetical protein CC86DRAFT_412196 [Ophiobolus disseminans]|uniref:Uncharacterized protein n=1 Tax=Ophiobolus disseminans TaxID=1469910 RepID=A0A6A6ZGS1_9PLEO|nr:hypothetical protein CC86DRAFT_412196 [Ophiobolus disseminans]
MITLQTFPFLSLLPEIRNRIYGILFEHGDPLCVVHVVEKGAVGKKGGNKGLLHHYTHDRNGYLEFCTGVSLVPQDSRATWPNLDLADTNLQGAYQPALALFRVCRQIHEEAASTFYKNNVFKICRKRICKHEGHTPGRSRRTWYQRIIFVKSSEIPETCQDWNVLNWYSNPPTSSPASPPIDNGCNLNALNDLLSSLLRDELDVNKYGRALGSLGLRRDRSGGFIGFWTTGGCGSWYIGGGHDLENPTQLSIYSTDMVKAFEADAGKDLRLLK